MKTFQKIKSFDNLLKFEEHLRSRGGEPLTYEAGDDIIITEKIDGANAQVLVKDGQVLTFSHHKPLTEDNTLNGFYGFVNEREAFKNIPEGYAVFGEWYSRNKGGENMIKGVKIRLYPNKHQQNQLLQMFGNDRFLWNQMLALAKSRYKNNPSSHFVNEYGMNYLVKQLKVEYSFLKESDSSSLQVSNHNLAQAFKTLFKHQGGYPRFKSRHSAKQSYTGKSTCKIVAKRRIKLPKLGNIRTSKTNRLNGCKIKRYTLSLEPTGRYYLSLTVEDNSIKPLEKTGAVVGIDLGVADLAITSDGKKYESFKPTYLDKQVRTWQSKFSKRRYRATKAVRQWNYNHKTVKEELEDYSNWQRAKRIKACYQAKIANKRKDYLHKITTELVNNYDVIVIEDLRTKNLLKNHHLAKSISGQSWREFRILLEYKCKWYGKKLVMVSPSYTSQICSNCGFHSGKKPLEIREWNCPKCGTRHDRDINAAVNILDKGLEKLRVRD